LGRYFTVVFYSLWFEEMGREGVERVLRDDLKYRFVKNEHNGSWWEKGNKIATFIGLVNWNLLYRKVFVEEVDRNKVRFIYHFSWLTNVGVLISAARGELGYLQQVFKVEKMEVERLR